MRVALITVALTFAASTLAAPCTAPVNGYKPGQKIIGQVRYAGDGDQPVADQAL